MNTQVASSVANAATATNVCMSVNLSEKFIDRCAAPLHAALAL
jgi:hypothetical protein